MDELISTGDAKTRRRNFLSLAVAATAGAIATVLSKSNEALAGHDGTNVFHLGEFNDARALPAPTRLIANIARTFFGTGSTDLQGATLILHNTGTGLALNAAGGGVLGTTSSGPGIEGFSESGPGVDGHTTSSSPGIVGRSSSGPGVEGRSASGPGVQGFANAASPVVDGSGVLGRGSALWPGVRGFNSAGQAPAVDGTTAFPFGTGVFGQCRADDGFAVRGLNHGRGPAASFTNNNPNNPAPAVEGVTSGSGPGVRGSSASGPGVLGLANGSNPGVVGIGSPQRSGVAGQTADGLAVHGIASGSGIGMRGDSSSGLGLHGVSGTGIGVRADSASNIAVWAFGRTGVEAHGNQGLGVFGTSAQFIGVQGSGAVGGVFGNSVNGVGVRAESSGLALDVVGRARFSTAGTGTVAAKSDSSAVSNPAVLANSNVTVTLTSDPGGAQIAWVERNPGSGFVLHMSKKVDAATTFAYLITESA